MKRLGPISIVGLVTGLVLSAALVGAEELHSGLCLAGCPSGATHTNDLIIREIYILDEFRNFCFSSNKAILELHRLCFAVA